MNIPLLCNFIYKYIDLKKREYLYKMACVCKYIKVELSFEKLQ